ncbi:MAG: histidine kinase [Bacteroidota bacterium]
MKNKKFHIIAFVVMIWNFSFAQLHTNYTISDGLPSNHVYRITQDSKGFIWVITDKGIARFNGEKFTAFTTKNGLPTNDIWDLREGPNNRIWYFSKSAIIGYIQDDKVYNFPACVEKDILYPSEVFQYGNSIVFGNGEKCYALINNCWEHISRESAKKKPTWNENMDERSIIAGLAYFYYNNSAPFGIENKEFTRERYLSKDSISGMLHEEGYMIYNLSTQEIFRGTFNDNFRPSKPIFTRFNFVNGEIQVSGFNVVAVLGKDGQPKQVIHIAEELQSHSSIIDRSGNVWSCTFTNGIYMLPQVNRQVTYHLLDQKINRINIINDRIIASVRSKGFYEYDEEKRRFSRFIDEKGFMYSASYVAPLKSYFYISESQILRESEGTITKEMSNVGLGMRKVLFANDTLYTTTSGGIKKRNPLTLTELKTYRQFGIKDIINFKGRILMGTSNGLKRIGKDSIYEIDFPNNPLQEPILDLVEVSPDQLLVGTDGFGAYLTDLEQIAPLVGSEFLSVEDAFVTDDGIWLATEIGALQYKKNEQGYYLVRKVDDSDGLPSRKINAVVVLGSEILVATDNGIAIFPEKLEKSPQFLDLYIQEGTYNNQSLMSGDASLQFSKRKHVNFSIASIDFSENKVPVEYEYKLSPNQSEWVTTTSSSLSFTDLKPDDYSFVIRSHGIEKALDFSIEPLWWQTQWFKAIAILVFAIVLGSILFFILKIFQKKHTRKLIQEKQLAQIQLKALRSQMNPHFVFNSLAAIQYYINNNDFEASETYLVKFSKLIRTFFELSKESEITIGDEVLLLKNYLDLEQLRFRNKFSYQINVDPNLNGKQSKIPAMLLQPIVENAVNHGIFNKVNQGNVTVDFKKVSSNEILVSILDDGVGFVNTRKGGLRKMKSSNVLRDRLYYLNQSLHWKVTYATREAFPASSDKGNISTFTIIQKQ